MIEKEYVDLSKDESDQADQELVQVRTRKYYQLIRKSLQWFKVNFLPRIYTPGRPLVKEYLKDKEREIWRAAMRKEIQTLKEMKCWDIVTRPAKEQVTHRNLVLLPKQDEQTIVREHEAYSAVCENEEIDCRGDHFLRLLNTISSS